MGTHEDMERNEDKPQLNDKAAQDNGPREGEEPVMVEISEAEIDKLRREVADYKDRNIRLCAEFDNARKRMEKDKSEFVKYANEKVMSDFLEVLDNLERTVVVAQSKHQDYDAFLKGIEMVMAALNKMLQRNGLKPIEAKGKKFDPHCHEILTMEETDSVEEGIVLEELQKGYYLGERVLRTVKVKLAKSKASDAGESHH